MLLLLFVVVDNITIRIEISLHLYILLSDPIWKIKYINRFTPLETDQSLDNIFPDIPSPFCPGLPSKNQGFKSINFNSWIKPSCKDCKKEDYIQPSILVTVRGCLCQTIQVIQIQAFHCFRRLNCHNYC